MIQIVDQMLPGFDSLRFFYEEKSIYFVDGYDLVNLLLIKFFETITDNFKPDASMPAIYKEYKKTNEDLTFVKTLFKKTVLRDDEYTEIIRERTKNWEYDRIPLMDIIFRRGYLLNYVSSSHMFSALLAIILTLVVFANIFYKPKKYYWRFGVGTIILILTFIIGNFLLFNVVH